MWPGAVLLSALAVTEPHAYYSYMHGKKGERSKQRRITYYAVSMLVKNH